MLGIFPPAEDEKISHGICIDCSLIIYTELEQELNGAE
jgi:hypothetical protein